MFPVDSVISIETVDVHSHNVETKVENHRDSINQEQLLIEVKKSKSLKATKTSISNEAKRLVRAVKKRKSSTDDEFKIETEDDDDDDYDDGDSDYGRKPLPKKKISCESRVGKKRGPYKKRRQKTKSENKIKQKKTLKKSRGEIAKERSVFKLNKLYEDYMLEHFDMKCDICTKIFKSFFEAKSHYAEEHNELKGYVKCCNKKMKEMWAVHDHISYHLNPDSLS